MMGMLNYVDWSHISSDFDYMTLITECLKSGWESLIGDALLLLGKLCYESESIALSLMDHEAFTLMIDLTMHYAEM